MTYLGSTIDSLHGQIYTSGTSLGTLIRAIAGGSANTTSTAWPANNDAYAIPFQLSFPMSFTGMFWVSGTSPGTANVDLGVYSEIFVRLASIGATASVNTTDIIQPAGAKAFSTSPLVLPRGRYYMAMSAAATTITTRSQASTLNQTVRALGVFKMATAHPLPDPFVPASVGSLVSIPLIGMVTASGVLL